MADQGSEGRLSPFLRRQRFQAAKPFLKGRALDFGCGSGGLAALIDSERYLGVEIDPESLREAQKTYPNHSFQDTLPNDVEKFDTIISLAVIEHVSDPSVFLATLRKYLSGAPSARIIITTPHPSVDWVHHLGAKFGLFSQHADEEHEELLDEQKLRQAGDTAALELISYKRFLWGANQLAIYRRI